jgi:ParB/RepB/Spo0J family partition protein
MRDRQRGGTTKGRIMSTVTTDATYEVLELGRIHESPLNPRRTYDPAKLQELAASIRAKGIITPLLVRPNGKGFEIASGHRRRRAAELAGVATAPCLIRAMDDAEFVEILNIENLQREDLTPLEEAEGYRLLMTKAGYSVERIAERIGKSDKYVYDRVKLLALIPEAQTLLRAEKITAGHAILLARLKPAEQARAIDRDRGGLFEHENILTGPDGRGLIKDPSKAVSVRELEGWIDQHVRFDAKATDPMIFPETAATLAAVQEQAEKVVKLTHNFHVQDEARDPKERTFGPMSWRRADGQKKSKTCALSVTGVIVVGPGRGEAFKVCVNRDKCDIHWGAEKRERARLAARGQVGASQKGREATSWQREEAKRKEQQARAEAEQARWKKARPAILEALAAAVKKAPTKAGGLLAGLIFGRCQRNYQAQGLAVARYVPRGSTAEDVVRHAAFIVVADQLCEWEAPTEFPKRAKAFGIDVRKIVDAAAPVDKPKAEEKPASGSAAKKTSVKKGTKK